jgi:hypothetical protein
MRKNQTNHKLFLEYCPVLGGGGGGGRRDVACVLVSAICILKGDLKVVTEYEKDKKLVVLVMHVVV